MYDGGHTVSGDANEEEGQGEEGANGYLAMERHCRAYNDGYGKGDEKDVGDDVADTHDEELGIACPAAWTGVRCDLPVVREWLTFGERGDHDSTEGNNQEDADEAKHTLVHLGPHGLREALEVFRNGELGDPDARAACQYTNLL